MSSSSARCRSGVIEYACEVAPQRGGALSRALLTQCPSFVALLCSQTKRSNLAAILQQTGGPEEGIKTSPLAVLLSSATNKEKSGSQDAEFVAHFRWLLSQVLTQGRGGLEDGHSFHGRQCKAAKEDWIGLASSLAQKTLEEATMLALNETLRRDGEDAQTTTSTGSSSSKAKTPLRGLLSRARLLPPSGSGVGGAGGLSQQQLCGQVLVFAMAEQFLQFWLLVEAALGDAVVSALQELRSTLSTRSGEVTPAMSDAEVSILSQVLDLLAALALADHRSAYPFPEKAANKLQYSLLVNLSRLGLIYPVAHEGQRWYVVPVEAITALAGTRPTILSTSGGIGGGLATAATPTLLLNPKDSIITETNFRLYAYSSSPTTLEVLKRFAILEVSLGNFHCFTVTAASFREAITVGLTAQQILRFLALKAHPAMFRGESTTATSNVMMGDSSQHPQADNKKRAAAAVGKDSTGSGGTSIIPQSIVDQFIMWEREGKRLRMADDCCLISAPTATAGKQIRQLLESYLRSGTAAPEAIVLASSAEGLLSGGPANADSFWTELLQGSNISSSSKVRSIEQRDSIRAAGAAGCARKRPRHHLSDSTAAGGVAGKEQVDDEEDFVAMEVKNNGQVLFAGPLQFVVRKELFEKAVKPFV